MFSMILHFLPDCKDLPAVRNATCVERFGLYRNIGRGSKFKCNEGFSRQASFKHELIALLVEC
jgi:hypothetical protein